MTSRACKTSSGHGIPMESFQVCRPHAIDSSARMLKIDAPCSVAKVEDPSEQRSLTSRGARKMTPAPAARRDLGKLHHEQGRPELARALWGRAMDL